MHACASEHALAGMAGCGAGRMAAWLHRRCACAQAPPDESDEMGLAEFGKLEKQLGAEA